MTNGRAPVFTFPISYWRVGGVNYVLCHFAGRPSAALWPADDGEGPSNFPFAFRSPTVTVMRRRHLREGGREGGARRGSGHTHTCIHTLWLAADSFMKCSRMLHYHDDCQFHRSLHLVETNLVKQFECIFFFCNYRQLTLSKIIKDRNMFFLQ